ncbi:MAG: hypothetical protein QOH47_788 [Sphingomonadales bacterium]|jgi:hypothetical protein|nr:hypothetical protein [Sphingomonadales bacterium]
MTKSGKYPASLAVGVAQEEEAPPAVACARFSRREEARFCRVAQPSKAGDDVGESQGQVSLDVFAEDPIGADLVDDAGDVGPKVTRIRVARAFAGGAEGLTRVAGRDEMNAATPRSAVEGSKIAPDRRRCQGLVFHPCHESGRRVAFPLNETNSPVGELGDVQAEIEAGVAGAEGNTPEVSGLRPEVGR